MKRTIVLCLFVGILAFLSGGVQVYNHINHTLGWVCCVIGFLCAFTLAFIAMWEMLSNNK